MTEFRDCPTSGDDHDACIICNGTKRVPVSNALASPAADSFAARGKRGEHSCGTTGDHVLCPACSYERCARLEERILREMDARADWIERAQDAERERDSLKSQLAERTAEVERLKQANASASEAVDRALRCDNWSDRLTAIRDARDRLERVIPKESGT